MYSLDRAVWSGADGIEPEAGAIFLILLDVRHFRRCGWMAPNPLPNPEHSGRKMAQKSSNKARHMQPSTSALLLHNSCHVNTGMD